MVASQVKLENVPLEDWMQEPAEAREWIDGKLVEKNGRTLKHSRIQARFADY